MKEELQAFQETAKVNQIMSLKMFGLISFQGTFLYGGQLLTAALALRNSCKLPDDLTIKLQERLEETWRKLEAVTQEQMTRLRVCAVFHRSVEEVRFIQGFSTFYSPTFSLLSDLIKNSSKIFRLPQVFC